VQIWGSKYWALGGLNQKKMKEQRFVEGHGELTAQNGSISSKKKPKRSNCKNSPNFVSMATNPKPKNNVL